MKVFGNFAEVGDTLASYRYWLCTGWAKKSGLFLENIITSACDEIGKHSTYQNLQLFIKSNKMLSCCRVTLLQGALYFSTIVEDLNRETIFYGHYRSIFNHCDIIGLKICRIR